MSEFMTALVMSAGIFAVMMASQFGRREYTARKVLIPVVAVAGFGYEYLRDVPTSGNAIWLYVVGVVIGIGFAVLATVTTGVQKDQTTNKLYTVTGVGFVITWLVAVVLRVGFVWGVDNVSSFRQQVGIFMLNHQLVQDSIAPFFVLMALATVIGRVVAVKVRMNRLAHGSTSQAWAKSATPASHVPNGQL